jgi:hypothetical protein
VGVEFAVGLTKKGRKFDFVGECEPNFGRGVRQNPYETIVA